MLLSVHPMKLNNLLPFRRNKPKPKSWTQTHEGILNQSWDWGWWQQDLKPLNNGLNETVEACISALSQTVSMMPIHHLEDQEDGESKRLYGSKAERVLKFPNPQETRTVFFNNLIRSVYFTGNGYGVVQRDGNRAVEAIYLVDPRATEAVQDPESGEVFYWVSPLQGQKFNIETDRVYPSRDVLHVKLHTSSERPLHGESPIASAARSVAANSAIIGHQAQFFNNMSRPSGVLVTEKELKLEQMKQLREAFESQSKAMASGRIPILGQGLKWESLSLSSQDAQLVEAYGMTVESISKAFRVPLPIINDMTGSTFTNSEALMRWFLSSGLGFLMENIELELDRLFDLPFKQHINFDTKQLLRSDWKTQIEALGEGVLKGIYSPNEARAMIGLGAVEDGDEPRVQQQVVPLSAWDQSEPVPPAAPEVTDEQARAMIQKGLANVG